MCRLTQQVFETEDYFGDAIVIQTKGDPLKADYHQAKAIIRRIDTDDGVHWLFNNLLHTDNVIGTCSGVKGNQGTVIRAATYQFGTDFSHLDFVRVTYIDLDFPHSLLPH